MIDSTGPARLADPENWHGGFYELSIELGSRNDERLGAALQVLWRAAGATGPFGEDPPGTYEEVDLSLDSMERHGHLHGQVEAPPFGKVVCGMLAFRADDESDWLALYLPLGALSRAHPAVGGYPFGDYDASAWRPALDAWLASIGTKVYEAVPFVRANIGMESLGDGEDTDLDGHLLPDGGAVRYVPGTLEIDA